MRSPVVQAATSAALQPRGTKPQQLVLKDLAAGILEGADPSKLTVLHCISEWGSILLTPGACLALGRLTGLVELRLCGRDRELPGDAAPVLAKLSLVTGLTLYGNLSNRGLALLPSGLKQLELHRASSIKASHFRRLEQLTLHNPACTTQQLQALGKLRPLRSLSLSYSDRDEEPFDTTVAHAGGWRGLPLLKSLGLKLDGEVSAEVAAGIAAATSLTRLDVLADRWAAVNVRTMVMQLAQLQEQAVARYDPLDNPPVHSLAGLAGAITGLTRLAFLGQLQLPALAEVWGMTQLRQLALQDAELGDMGLAAMGERLLQLKLLGLGDYGVSREGLLAVLTEPSSLPALEELVVPLHAEEQEGAADAIMAARPELPFLKILKADDGLWGRSGSDGRRFF